MQYIYFLLFISSVHSLWTQNDHDAQHSNQLPYDSNRGYLTCGPTLGWVRYDMSVHLNNVSYYHQPIIGNSFTYYYISDMTLRAISAENNRVFWQINGNYFSEPVLSSDATFLFTFVNSSIVQKYNATSGALIETMDIGITSGYATLANYDNLLYLHVGSALFQIQMEPKLKENWRMENVSSMPSIDINGNLVFASGNGIAVISNSQHKMWEYASNVTILKTRIRSDNMIISSTQCGTLFSNQTFTNKISNFATFAIFSDDSIFGSTACTGTYTHLFRVKTDGDYIWNVTATSLTHIYGASIDGDQVVYLSGVLNYLQPVVIGINASDGDILWTFPISDSGDMLQPVIIGDSSILVTIGNSIYRINPCNNRGICDKTECDCVVNWYRDTCTQFCDNAQCIKYSNNNGQCDSTGTCVCAYNYFPRFNCTVFCNISDCAFSRGNNSHCSELGCVCNDHYYGDKCDSLCVNGVFREGNCQCLKNYFGESCDVHCEASENCNSNGYCGDNGMCVCNSGYEGNDCASKKPKSWLWIIAPSVGGACLCTGLIGGYVYKRKKKQYEPIK